jgi:hypothetical protein
MTGFSLHAKLVWLPCEEYSEEEANTAIWRMRDLCKKVGMQELHEEARAIAGFGQSARPSTGPEPALNPERGSISLLSCYRSSPARLPPSLGL